MKKGGRHVTYENFQFGLKSVAATATRKNYIQYQCFACSRLNIYRCGLTVQVSKLYHALQPDGTKEQKEHVAWAMAVRLLDEQDMELYHDINMERSYGSVTFKVRCPDCKKVQPWSGIPCEWKKSKLIWLWSFCLLTMPVTDLAMLVYSWKMGIVFLIGTVAILWWWPQIRTIRRKKVIRKVNRQDFVPPAYYNELNMQELINGPKAYLMKD